MEIKMTIIYERADGLIQASVAELPGASSVLMSRRRGEIWMKQSRWCWKETACWPKMLPEKKSVVKKSRSAPHEANRFSSAS
jgi:hypothetical protein